MRVHMESAHGKYSRSIRSSGLPSPRVRYSPKQWMRVLFTISLISLSFKFFISFTDRKIANPTQYDYRKCGTRSFHNTLEKKRRTKVPECTWK